MNFTDSPFERMMKEVPHAPYPEKRDPPAGSACRNCPDWPRLECMGICHRKLTLAVTSGQVGPKLAESRDSG